MAVLEDRIVMAEQSDEPTLDMMFEWLEPAPEGYKVEIVQGAVYMSPQRDNHWDIIADVYEQLRARYPRKRVKSDVRIDYPGRLNGFAPTSSPSRKARSRTTRASGATRTSSSSLR